MSNYETVFSECRRYRYAWRHTWDATAGTAMFVGLNPSTADEQKTDPTIRRCIRFAKDWGYGSLVMMNLFAWKATDPADMKAAEDPVGPYNDDWLVRQAAEANVVVAAWGTHGAHMRRDQRVRQLLPHLFALRITKEGHPGHPLYLPASLKPVRWR